MGNKPSCCFDEDQSESPIKESSILKPAFASPNQNDSNKTESSSNLLSSKPQKSNRKVRLEDFVIMKEVGRGAFGKVYKVKHKATGKVYALKKLDKTVLIKTQDIEVVINEKSILMKTENDFLVKLHYSFQNPKFVFLVMDFMEGGELYGLLRSYGKFRLKAVKFYAAEILLGLEYLHTVLGVIYRDLKPENVLLDRDGHLRLTDFGLSKLGDITYSFAGTPEYIAPEIIRGKGHGKAVDYWSYGCLIYELLTGKPLFHQPDGNRDSLFRRITEEEPHIDPSLPVEARDLVLKLVEKRPEHRLGHDNILEIKSHIFFNDLDWQQIQQKKVSPPYIPHVKESGQQFSRGDFFPNSNSVARKDIPGITYQTPDLSGKNLKVS